MRRQRYVSVARQHVSPGPRAESQGEVVAGAMGERQCRMKEGRGEEDTKTRHVYNHIRGRQYGSIQRQK